MHRYLAARTVDHTDGDKLPFPNVTFCARYSVMLSSHRISVQSTELLSLRVVVHDTVDVVLNVHGEGHSIETLFTHHAAETARMVGLAQRLEDLDAHTNRKQVRLGSEAK